MSTKKGEPLNLGYVTAENVFTIICRPLGANVDYVYVLDRSGKVETHDPMDRVGGPFTAHGLIEDSDGDRWFMFWIEDCAFPVRYFVRGDSFEEAYEYFIDARESALRIDDEDLGDYGVVETTDSEPDWDDYRGSFSSKGIPVDTESVQGLELSLVSLHFRD